MLIPAICRTGEFRTSEVGAAWQGPNKKIPATAGQIR